MTRSSRLALGCAVLALAGLAGASSPSAPPANGKVALQTMTYPELARLVRGHTGKVVVVDMWGVF
jgi:hypothetical protein